MTTSVDSVQWNALLLGLAAGLALFLSGVGELGDSLKAMSNSKMRDFLSRYTKNRFRAVASGTVACTILDSSSATIILVLGLVHAGALTFGESLGVVLGANIGTTVSSQLFALKLTEYSPLALALGYLLRQVSNERLARLGRFLFSLGLVFFGLELMETATRPLRGYEPLHRLMVQMESPFIGVLVGAAFTAVIQSSSALMGIVIAFAANGSISLQAAIPLMMGAEIGTCADTLLASIGSSREALRTGLFQLAFNIGSVAIWIGFTGYLGKFARWSSPSDLKLQIANAHVAFNVASVILVLPFLPWIARAMEKIIPPRGSDRNALPSHPLL
jgi:phosphate:Na+ symporter